MCVYLFSNDATLTIVYANETIALTAGGSVDVVDLLVENSSNRDLDKIHIVYPHALPYGFSSDERYFIDLSSTWALRNHEYNKPYLESPNTMAIVTAATAGVSASSEASDLSLAQGAAKVIVTMPDSRDPIKVQPHSGWVKGDILLKHYVAPRMGQLGATEWCLLESGGFSVLTAEFEIPIPPAEKRWLRFKASGGVQQQNRVRPFRRFLQKYMGRLEDLFEIAGPLDVRHRIIQYLRSFGFTVASGMGDQGAVTAWQRLERDLLSILVASGTIRQSK